MATKTIVLERVTLHCHDAARSVPFKFDALGNTLQGHTEVIEHPPGTRVTLEAAEADRILDNHGGDEVDLETCAVIRSVVAPHLRGLRSPPVSEEFAPRGFPA